MDTVISNIEETLSEYPFATSEILVGGDSVFTEHVTVGDMLELCALARLGLSLKTLLRSAKE